MRARLTPLPFLCRFVSPSGPAERWKKTGTAWGGRASPHARHVRRPTCTIGMAVSYKGALRVLEALGRDPEHRNGPIDIVSRARPG